MKALSWADISSDKEQSHAYSEIVNFCHGFEIKQSERLDLAHVLMAMAVSAMDYTDPKDFSRDLAEDPDRARQIRLGNFMDYTFEFAGKRLALVQSEDAYLKKKMDEYLLSRKDMRVLQCFAGTNELASADMEHFMVSFDGLKDDLLMQGVPRLSLSKAFLDASFVFAKMTPVDEYINFCNYISESLNPKPQEESEDLGEVMSDMALLTMQSASASIH